MFDSEHITNASLVSLQNNYAELYALLSLALPKVFPLTEAQGFVAYFSDATNAATVLPQLRQLLAPVLLRRTIADVPSLGTPGLLKH